MVAGDERGSSKGKAAVRRALVGPWEMKDSLMVIARLVPENDFRMVIDPVGSRPVR
jgi:hypothetical protein